MANVTSYRSGASNIADLRGYILSGVPIGLACARISQGKLVYLSSKLEEIALQYSRDGQNIFFDSGAFPVFQHNIGSGSNLKLDFQKIMEKYAYYSQNGNPAMVMPDVIGDQNKTLDLQFQFRREIKSLVESGCDVIIPIQKGLQSPSECWDIVRKMISDEVRIAIPSNAEAFSLKDLTNLLSHNCPPKKIHLLGLTHANRLFKRKLAKIWEYVPEIDISCDGNRLRAMIGEGRPVTTGSKELTVSFSEIIKENSRYDDDSDTDIWMIIHEWLSDKLTPIQVDCVAAAIGADDKNLPDMYAEAAKGNLLAWIEDNIEWFGSIPEDALFKVVLSWEAKELIRISAGNKFFSNHIDDFFPKGFVFCDVPAGVARTVAVANNAIEKIPQPSVQLNLFNNLKAA